MPSNNAVHSYLIKPIKKPRYLTTVHSYLIKPITIPRYLTTVYCLHGAAPIGFSKERKLNCLSICVCVCVSVCVNEIPTLRVYVYVHFLRCVWMPLMDGRH
jgi:hypothetical protein